MWRHKGRARPRVCSRYKLTIGNLKDMVTATLIQSPEGYTIEFYSMVTGRPTWDLQRIVALLAALGVRNLDLRLNEALDDMQLLANHSDVLCALRRYRTTEKETSHRPDD